MKSTAEYAVLVILLLSAGPVFGADLKSPGGDLAVSVQTGRDGAVEYIVQYRGKPLLIGSRLGLEFADAPPLGEHGRITAVARDACDQTWRPVYGERSAHQARILTHWASNRHETCDLKMEEPR